MAFTHRGKVYTSEHVRKTQPTNLSILTIDRRANFKVMKGVRHILVPQFKTLEEMIGGWSENDKRLARAGELKPVDDPFPFAVVAMSREVSRDPTINDGTIEVRPGYTLPLAPLTPYHYRNNGDLEVYILCSACDEFQKPDAFYVDDNRPNGKRGWCKSCDNQRRVARRREARIGLVA